jgi:hypothetical protein
MPYGDEKLEACILKLFTVRIFLDRTGPIHFNKDQDRTEPD